MPTRRLTRFQAFWIRIWLTVVLVGLFLFLLGINPDFIGLDRSPVVGFIQVGVWLFGLALVLIGGYASIRIHRNGRSNSLRAEVGERLVATGYVVAAAASLADFIGIGSDTIPELTFGPLQIFGLSAGLILCFLGLLLYWPWKRRLQNEIKGDSEAGESGKKKPLEEHRE
ncbi:MAG: hypothetical protein IIC78_06100 [Chloroflexi bacterium]|nr:hypothetical protein [Chloroflexota bacterium]